MARDLKGDAVWLCCRQSTECREDLGPPVSRIVTAWAKGIERLVALGLAGVYKAGVRANIAPKMEVLRPRHVNLYRQTSILMQAP